MDNSTIIITTLFVVENLLLIALFFIWQNRKCQTCSKVKCLERTFNKLCSLCSKKNHKKSSDYQF